MWAKNVSLNQAPCIFMFLPKRRKKKKKTCENNSLDISPTKIQKLNHNIIEYSTSHTPSNTLTGLYYNEVDYS